MMYNYWWEWYELCRRGFVRKNKRENASESNKIRCIDKTNILRLKAMVEGLPALYPYVTIIC